MSEKTIKVGKAQAEALATSGFAQAVGELKPLEGKSTVVHVTAAPHSVEISRNASGGVSVSVKCYGATVDEALAAAVARFAALDAQYPVAPKVAK